MTDYDPRPPTGSDPGPGGRNNPDYIDPGAGKGLYLMVGVLVAIVLAAGLLFFTAAPGDRTDQAREPDRTLNVPTNEPRTPAIPPRADPAPNPTTPAPKTE